MVSVVRAGEHTVVPWKNGRGVTREVHKGGIVGDGQWGWRVSAAAIDADGPFSSFPDIQRFLAVISGPGVDLTVDGAPVACDPFAVVQFPGDATTVAALRGGVPVGDLNLMLDPARFEGSMAIVTAPCDIHDANIVIGLGEGAEVAVIGGRASAGPIVLGHTDAVMGLDDPPTSLSLLSGMVAVIEVCPT